MKILQLANGYLGSRLYSLLFDALAQHGATNHIFVPIKSSGSEQRSNIDIVPCFTQLDRLLFFAKQRKIISAVEVYYGDIRKFDVIHAHTLFSAGYAAMQWKRKYGIPYVVAVRNTDVNTFFRYMIHLRRVGVQIMREADAVIFLSKAYQDNVLANQVPAQYRAEIAQKSHVIPNGISPMFLADKAAPHSLRDGAPLRLVYAGEINRNKNLETTVAAAKLLIGEGIPVTLDAIGQIKEESYRSLFAKNKFVSYHEKAPQEALKEHYRNADIFVMPSHTETFGLVYAEAMSQGLPVLYTRGQGFDGQFPDGTVGYSVDDHSPADLADKIKLVVEHYAELSRNCVEKADRFDWSKIAQEYKALYETIQKK